MLLLYLTNSFSTFSFLAQQVNHDLVSGVEKANNCAFRHSRHLLYIGVGDKLGAANIAYRFETLQCRAFQTHHVLSLLFAVLAVDIRCRMVLK